MNGHITVTTTTATYNFAMTTLPNSVDAYPEYEIVAGAVYPSASTVYSGVTFTTDSLATNGTDIVINPIYAGGTALYRTILRRNKLG